MGPDRWSYRLLKRWKKAEECPSFATLRLCVSHSVYAPRIRETVGRLNILAAISALGFVFKSSMVTA